MDKQRLLELAGITEDVSWGRLERGEYQEHIDLMAAHVVAMAHEDLQDAPRASTLEDEAEENLGLLSQKQTKQSVFPKGQ